MRKGLLRRRKRGRLVFAWLVVVERGAGALIAGLLILTRRVLRHSEEGYYGGFRESRCRGTPALESCRACRGLEPQPVAWRN